MEPDSNPLPLSGCSTHGKYLIPVVLFLQDGIQMMPDLTKKKKIKTPGGFKIEWCNVENWLQRRRQTWEAMWGNEWQSEIRRETAVGWRPREEAVFLQPRGQVMEGEPEPQRTQPCQDATWTRTKQEEYPCFPLHHPPVSAIASLDWKELNAGKWPADVSRAATPGQSKKGEDWLQGWIRSGPESQGQWLGREACVNVPGQCQPHQWSACPSRPWKQPDRLNRG